MTSLPAADLDIPAGFAAPVFDAQRIFRAILDAMAHPGTVIELGALAAAPAPLVPAAAAMLLCLADQDTPVWFDGEANAIAAWLGFHCGSPLVSRPQEAAFALVSNAGAMPAFDHFAQGSDEYPDRSATVIVQVPALEGGPALTLTGPGIRDTAVLAPAGLPDGFATWLADNHALFPRGVDLVLASGGQVAALPRSTRVGAVAPRATSRGSAAPDQMKG